MRQCSQRALLAGMTNGLSQCTASSMANDGGYQTWPLQLKWEQQGLLTCPEQICLDCCTPGIQLPPLKPGVSVQLPQSSTFLRVCGGQPFLLDSIAFRMQMSSLGIQLLKVFLCHPAVISTRPVVLLLRPQMRIGDSAYMHGQGPVHRAALQAVPHPSVISDTILSNPSGSPAVG